MNRFSKLYFCFILFCFLFISYNGYSQQSVELPSITPPSPTAYQMTQYGDVPVNESTGKISPSIPLYTYQVGRLQLPISLNYQGNGVKVDQAASWTGINWNLNAGGVISRVVRDGCDLITNYSQKQYYSYGEIVSMANNQEYGTINGFIIDGQLDTEVDIFNFSFPGYSGSFYFKEVSDGEFEAYLTKNDTPLQINLVPGDRLSTSREIVITSPDGIEYYFGGDGASEQSSIQQQGSTDVFQTAFYLYKIKHPLGDEINFEYETINYHNYSAITQRYTKLVDVQECATPSGLDPYPDGGGMQTQKLRTIIENGRFLNKITSNKNDYEIILSSIPNDNTETNLHYKKVLQSLLVRNSNNHSDTINQVSFEYLYPKGEQSQRFFLERVHLFNGSKYEMVYNNPSNLPLRFSFAQDHLGFYNGKINNSRMLPRTDHSSFSTIYTSLADKSSVFAFSSLGTLTKIYYPTGGYTEFKYEPNGSDEENSSSTIEINTPIYRNWHFQPPQTGVNRESLEISLGTPFIDINGNPDGAVLTDQNIRIKLDNVISNDHMNWVRFILTVTNITDSNNVVISTQEKQYQYGTHTGQNYDPYFNTSMFQYSGHTFDNIRLVAGNRYKIKVEIDASGNANESKTIYARVNFNYDVISTSTNEEGIRIEKVTDYISHEDNLELFANIKRYYYGGASEGIPPKYLYETEARGCCGTTQRLFYYINLVSSSINSLYSIGGNEKTYSKVDISYGGDNFEKGGVKKEFIIRGDGLPINTLTENENYNLPNVRENRSVVNGTLKKETFYGVGNYPLRETNYYYELDDFGERTINNSRTQLYSVCFDPSTTIEHLYLGIYETISTKVQLDSVISKSYDYGKLFYLDTDRDGNPDYNDTDANGNGMVDFLEPGYDGGVDLPEPNVQITKTTYEYTQHVGMPTKETVSTSTSEETIETTYTYPSESTLNSTYISEPIRIQKSKKVDGQEIPLSSISRVHSSSGAFPNYNGSKNLLSQIKTVKGPEFDGGVINLEERITYHDYDSMGNPIEVSKTDGTHIVYIWGYNQTLPIAKIENATYCYNGNNYSQSNCLEQTDVENLQLLSNQDIDSISEENLRVALNGLRNSLTNSMVTTYTYDPLIGVTSMTDPRGQVVYYEYDEFNRLQYIKDKDGYILSKNDYRYQTQN